MSSNRHRLEQQQRLTSQKLVNYSYGPYNKMNKTEQWIRITEGCPNNCPYCYEPQEIKIFPIPKIERNIVKIMDMNLLCKPESESIIKTLGTTKVNNKMVRYELLCGIDYRFMNPSLARLLHESHFERIRLAWDWGLNHQMKVYDCINLLVEAGYSSKSIMVFMVCNWKISYESNCRKLDLLKVWRVKACDCYFDNQIKHIEPIHWTDEQIKDFRRRVRKHNQLINFGIDPELNEVRT